MPMCPGAFYRSCDTVIEDTRTSTGYAAFRRRETAFPRGLRMKIDFRGSGYGAIPASPLTRPTAASRVLAQS